MDQFYKRVVRKLAIFTRSLHFSLSKLFIFKKEFMNLIRFFLSNDTTLAPSENVVLRAPPASAWKNDKRLKKEKKHRALALKKENLNLFWERVD